MAARRGCVYPIFEFKLFVEYKISVREIEDVEFDQAAPEKPTIKYAHHENSELQSVNTQNLRVSDWLLIHHLIANEYVTREQLEDQYFTVVEDPTGRRRPGDRVDGLDNALTRIRGLGISGGLRLGDVIEEYQASRPTLRLPRVRFWSDVLEFERWERLANNDSTPTASRLESALWLNKFRGDDLLRGIPLRDRLAMHVTRLKSLRHAYESRRQDVGGLLTDLKHKFAAERAPRSGDSEIGKQPISGTAGGAERSAPRAPAPDLYRIPPGANRYFVGREAVMAALGSEGRMSGYVGVTHALWGMGGMGKTATAIEYARRSLDKVKYPEYPAYRAIQNTRADTVEVLKYGYAEIANALQLRRADPTNLDEAVQAVLQWMMQPGLEPFLLILDNADIPEHLVDFLPQEPHYHRGHVIVTSRAHRFKSGITPVEIREMLEEESVRLLFERTARARIPGSKEEQAAKELAGATGGLPLLLEQAAAYLTQPGGQEMSFADYLAEFKDDKQRSVLMTFPPGSGAYRQYDPDEHELRETLTVRTTWNLTLATIQAQHPHSVELLRLCAFLHPTGIPRELTIALLPEHFGPAEGDADQLRRLYNSLLTVLADYSLIHRDFNPDAHSLHIMLQTVLLDLMSPGERSQFAERIVAAIAASFPTDDFAYGGRGTLFYPHAERMRVYAEQRGMEGESVIRLHDQIAEFLDNQGRHTEVERYLKSALAMRERVLPANHPEITRSRQKLGKLYWFLERYPEAQPLLGQALQARTMAGDRTGMAESMCLQAGLYKDIGRIDEACSLYLEALELWKEADEAGKAHNLDGLGLIYFTQRRFTEAETRFNQALEIRRRVGPDIVIAETLNNLGSLYLVQRQIARAAPLLEEAHRLYERAFPPGHLAVGISAHNVAKVYQAQGRLEEAEALYIKAMESWEHLPEVNSHTYKTLMGLAGVYRLQGRLQDGESVLDQARLAMRKANSTDHPTFAVNLNLLGSIYHDYGRLEEAEALYTEALEMSRRVLPGGHLDIADILNNLARLRNDRAT